MATPRKKNVVDDFDDDFADTTEEAPVTQPSESGVEPSKAEVLSAVFDLRALMAGMPDGGRSKARGIAKLRQVEAYVNHAYGEGL